MADSARDGSRVRPRAVLQAVLREQTTEQVGLAASGAAFWLVISVFPTAIAAVSIYGLVVSPEHVADNLSGLANNGPQSLGATLADQLQKVVTANRGGLTVGLVVSVVLALWSASAGIYNLERAVRVSYGLGPANYVRARSHALLGAILGVLALGVAALVSTTAAIVVDHVPVVVAVIVGVPLALGLIAAIAAALYRLSIGSTRVGRLLPGSVATSIGLSAVVAGFAVYLRFSTRYTAVYGALAGTVIGMIGTYLGVYVVLLGAVLNAQLDDTRVTHPVPEVRALP